MIPWLINIALALGWGALLGEISARNLFIGFVLGYLILKAHQRVVGESTYYLKVRQTIVLIVAFCYALVASSFNVAAFVLFPWRVPKPAIISVPLDARTDFEIVILGNIISLTPGTLTLDVAPDRSALYVHCMDAPDPEAVGREIKQQLERPLLELMR